MAAVLFNFYSIKDTSRTQYEHTDGSWYRKYDNQGDSIKDFVEFLLVDNQRYKPAYEKFSKSDKTKTDLDIYIQEINL